VEAGVDYERAGRAGDRPDVVVDRLARIVRIAADVSLRPPSLMSGIFDGVDFVDVVGHGVFLSRWIYAHRPIAVILRCARSAPRRMIGHGRRRRPSTLSPPAPLRARFT